jgi:dynactin complex subunit
MVAILKILFSYNKSILLRSNSSFFKAAAVVNDGRMAKIIKAEKIKKNKMAKV